MRTISGVDLGIQAWAGVGRPDYWDFRPLERTGEPTAKPKLGYFTCNWNTLDQPSTPWLIHMQKRFLDEQPARSGAGKCLWTLTPKPEAILYVIDSLDAYIELADLFRQMSTANARYYAPNWCDIAQSGHVDGVHVTDAAIKEGLAGGSMIQPQLIGWSVESTLWPKWSLIDPKFVCRVAAD